MLTFLIFIIIFGLLTGRYKGFIYKKTDGVVEIRFMPVLFAVALFWLIYYIINNLNNK